MSGKAQRWLVGGRVQGVGYRAFLQREAARLGLVGYARNLADGSVDVYASGSMAQLDRFSGAVRSGPPFADVRTVEVREAQLEAVEAFRIR